MKDFVHTCHEDFSSKLVTFALGLNFLAFIEGITLSNFVEEFDSKVE